MEQVKTVLRMLPQSFHRADGSENLPAAEQRALPTADELTAAFDQISSNSYE
ncbi:hypothetical protein ACX80F_14170 [Arthrobacter sp. TMS2-4]